MTQGRLTLAEMLRGAVEARLLDLHVALPGRVRSYDVTKQVAEVEPMIPRALLNSDEDQAETLEDLPIIPEVPVLWPRGGGFYLHMPLTAGDTVLLVFPERSIGNWRASGNKVDPGDRRMHSLAGAVAIPGLFPAAQAVASADAGDGDLALGKEGAAQIRVTPSDVLLGDKTATSRVALADLVRAEFNLVATTLASLAGATFGTPYPPPGPPNELGATKVKAI